jgi:hypothetical protein
MKQVVIISLILFILGLLVSTVSAQLVPACDPAFDACIILDPSTCDVMDYLCPQPTPDPFANPTKLTGAEGNDRNAQQRTQQNNEDFNRLMEIMRRYRNGINETTYRLY